LAFGSDPDQFQRWPNIFLVLNPKADPARTRKNMMRQSAAIPQKLIAIRPADEAIQQTVSMNVAGLFPSKKETNPAEAVDAQGHARKPLRILFDGANRAQAARVQQGGRKQKHRVKYLWRARHLCEPSQFSNDERENHGSAQNFIASAEAARSAAH
jgi:hypothetical protein